METPNTPAGRLTDRLMIKLAPFLQTGAYNRAWSTTLAILEAELGTVPATEPGDRCKKMVRGTLYRCRKSAGHADPCGLR